MLVGNVLLHDAEKSSASDFLASFPPSRTVGPQWIQVFSEPELQFERPRYDVAAMGDDWERKVASAAAGDLRITPEVMINFATKWQCLGGKWMIFENGASVDVAWRAVARATLNGDLGNSAKVSTYCREDSHLICVYTDDISDVADVARVLYALRGMGYKRKVHYEADVYSLLGIYKDNPWELRHFLFSSTDPDFWAADGTSAASPGFAGAGFRMPRMGAHYGGGGDAARNSTSLDAHATTSPGVASPTRLESPPQLPAMLPHTAVSGDRHGHGSSSVPPSLPSAMAETALGGRVRSPLVPRGLTPASTSPSRAASAVSPGFGGVPTASAMSSTLPTRAGTSYGRGAADTGSSSYGRGGTGIGASTSRELTGFGASRPSLGKGDAAAALAVGANDTASVQPTGPTHRGKVVFVKAEKRFGFLVPLLGAPSAMGAATASRYSGVPIPATQPDYMFKFEAVQPPGAQLSVDDEVNYTLARDPHTKRLFADYVKVITAKVAPGEWKGAWGRAGLGARVRLGAGGGGGAYKGKSSRKAPSIWR